MKRDLASLLPIDKVISHRDELESMGNTFDNLNSGTRRDKTKRGNSHW